MSIKLDVIVNDKPIRKYSEPETNDTFVEGRKGSEYSIKITNTYPYKVKVVVSVDGLNILTGDTVWEQGYAIYPSEIVTIPGWRINKDPVAKFVFSDIKEAYNSENKASVGVIGVMAFKEVVKTYNISSWPSNDYWPKPSLNQFRAGSSYGSNSINLVASSASNISDFLSSQSSNEVATGWGGDQLFKTTTDYTKFEDKPFSTQSIYYDSAKGLERRGINVKTDYIKPSA